MGLPLVLQLNCNFNFGPKISQLSRGVVNSHGRKSREKALKGSHEGVLGGVWVLMGYQKIGSLGDLAGLAS